MSAFALYMIGFLMIIGGLGYGAFRLGVPHVWIIIGTIIVLGIGFTTGASRTRRRDL
jgi:ABC-type multidrug transport system permease subunit